MSLYDDVVTDFGGGSNKSDTPSSDIGKFLNMHIPPLSSVRFLLLKNKKKSICFFCGAITNTQNKNCKQNFQTIYKKKYIKTL